MNADAEKRIFMAKQRRTLEKKAEERKIRTHRLIQIGGEVESVLGRPVVEEDVPQNRTQLPIGKNVPVGEVRKCRYNVFVQLF